MPLIQCPDCQNEVSDRAPACPKCGAPIAPSAVASPSAGSKEAVHKGNQKSTFKQHLGNGIAFVGICVAVVAGMAGGFQVGAGVAFGAVLIGVIVAYT